jgi:hypothetical protein
MSMVKDAAAMRHALEEALSLDTRALVEERLMGTELTVGVIGNRELQALPVIEIVSKRDFFDYRAKYDPALSEESAQRASRRRTPRARSSWRRPRTARSAAAGSRAPTRSWCRGAGQWCSS